MADYVPDLDLQRMLGHLVDLALAFLLALPVGWDRERSTRQLGLRTFPLVALASCGFVLMARDTLGDDAGALARVLEGLIAGVGFLGGGAIVKSGLSVRGTSTAASIWLTGAIGASIAFDRWEIAIILSVANFAILRWLGGAKDLLTHRHDDDDSVAPSGAEEKEGPGTRG